MRNAMTLPRLSNLEMQILESLWKHGASSVREIQERFGAKKRPAYTTVQTMVSRLEAKKAVRRCGKASAAFIFEAAISRNAARRRLIDNLLAVFGGEPQPVMSHLIESGRLTLDDIQDAEQHLREVLKKKKDKKP
jgi:BlaI family transcriptional regulator, penicillinase repressor